MRVIPYVSDQPLYPALHDIANKAGQGKVRFVKSRNGKGIHFGVETHTEVWTYSPKQLMSKSNVVSLLGSAIRLYLNPEERATLDVPYVVTTDLSALTGKTWIIDIETAGSLDGEPEDRPQLSIGIWDGNSNNPVHVIPGDQYPENLGELLSSKNLVAHHSQFDLKDLNYWLGTKLRARHDTMVMHYALHSQAGAHGLKDLCRLYLGVDDWDRGVKEHTTRGRDYSHVPREQLYEYNAKDVYYTAMLWQYLNKRLQGQQREFYENRMLKSHFLQGIEEGKGIHIDVPYFEQLDKEMSVELKEMLANLPINPNSPKQVKEFFGSNDSSEATLKKLVEEEHPKAAVVQDILEFRKLKKLHGTYVQGILKRLKGNYIHPRFKVAATVTGRLASENVNAQNIPRKSPIKRGLTAPPGYKVIAADYSQIEARVMAVLSGDENYRSAFQKDSPDFFDGLIPSMFPEDFPTYEDYYDFKYVQNGGHESYYRTVAKGIVYGMSFGRQAKAIGEAVGLTEAEAQSIINNYFRSYPLMKEWRQSIFDRILNNELYALTGMKFEQEHYWPSPMAVSALNREALSFLPQHHANEAMLMGLIAFNEHLAQDPDPDIGWIHAVVHDEGLAYIKEERAEHYAKILSECLSQAAHDLLGYSVEFDADPEIKDSWEEE